MKVEFTPVTDYAAAVEALATSKVDLAWFGGFTFVQAQLRSGGKVMPIVQRAEDEKFRSVFITTDAGDQDAGRPEGQERQLRLAVQHLGPPDAAQLPAAGRHRPRHATSSAWPSRARTTRPWPPSPPARSRPARSTSRCGTSWWPTRRSTPTKVRVFYTTPPYYDYNWTVHADMPAALREEADRGLPRARPGHAPRARRSWSCSAPRASSRPRPRTTRHRSRRAQRRPAEVSRALRASP